MIWCIRIWNVDLDTLLNRQTILKAELHEFLADIGANHPIVCPHMHSVGHADGLELLLSREQQAHDGDGLHCGCVICLL